jgi:phosphatidylinositol alpha-1,6-mannosyltransferase
MATSPPGTMPSPTPHLLLVHDFPPMAGGISRWMEEIARRYPVGELVVSTGWDPQAPAVDARFTNRVDRLSVPRNRLRTIPGLVAWSRRARALVQETRASFIWCGNVKPPAYAAYYAHARGGPPYGVILHGTDLLQLRRNVRARGYKRAIARRLLGRAAVVVTNSEWTRRLALELLGEIGLASGDLDVRAVPLGTDPAVFRPEIDTSAVRARYGLPDGRWMITVARLIAHKGQDVALRALARLVPEIPALRYAIVGRGAYRRELEALAASLGVADRVHILDNVSDADLPALYNVADVYVGASRNVDVHIEGFGISLVEAAACGLPVVGGRSGGVPEAVQDGVTGILVDPESPEAVAGAVRRLLDDRALAAQLGRAGRRAVEERFNWDRVVGELRAIARVAEGHRRAQAG